MLVNKVIFKHFKHNIENTITSRQMNVPKSLCVTIPLRILGAVFCKFLMLFIEFFCYKINTISEYRPKG